MRPKLVSSRNFLKEKNSVKSLTPEVCRGAYLQANDYPLKSNNRPNLQEIDQRVAPHIIHRNAERAFRFSGSQISKVKELEENQCRLKSLLTGMNGRIKLRRKNILEKNV